MSYIFGGILILFSDNISLDNGGASMYMPGRCIIVSKF